jgi:hypothetical protein
VEGGARQRAFNGAWRRTAQCPAATRATGELRPLNRSSCLGVTASARRPQESRHGQWGQWRRARAESGYGGNAVGWAAQVGFTRPMSVRRVAKEYWVRTSVGGLGTSGRSGALAVVPGRPVARPGVATCMTSRVGMNAWRWHLVEFDLALLEMSKLEISLQKSTNWKIEKL